MFGEAHADSLEEEESFDKHGDAREHTFDLHLLRRGVERSPLEYCDRRSSTRLSNDPPGDPPVAGLPLPSVCNQAVMPIHLVVPINSVRGFGRLVDVVEKYAAHRGGDQIGPTVLTRKQPIFCQDGIQNTAKKVRSSSIDHWSSPGLPYCAHYRTPRSTDSEELEGGDKDEGRGNGEDEIFARHLDQTKANIQHSKKATTVYCGSFTG